MKRLLGGRGFTVVETMIVLAVTGGLFLVIAATMAGRQARGEFNQSVGDARTQVQQTMREVESGFFPDTSNFHCQVSGAGLSFTPINQPQGTNDQCLFLGKMIVFTQGKDTYKVYTVAGERTDDSVEKIDADRPTVVDNGKVSITETHKFMYGLTPVKIKSAFGSNIGAVGFIMSLGKIGKDSSGKPAGYASGTQQVDLYAFKTPFAVAPAISTLNGAMRSSSEYSVNDGGGIEICFQSGTTHDYALMTIGSDSSNLSVQMQPNPKTDCGI